MLVGDAATYTPPRPSWSSPPATHRALRNGEGVIHTESMGVDLHVFFFPIWTHNNFRFTSAFQTMTAKFADSGSKFARCVVDIRPIIGHRVSRHQSITGDAPPIPAMGTSAGPRPSRTSDTTSPSFAHRTPWMAGQGCPPAAPPPTPWGQGPPTGRSVTACLLGPPRLMSAGWCPGSALAACSSACHFCVVWQNVAASYG